MRNDTRRFEADAIHAGEAEHSSSPPISLRATSDAVYYRGIPQMRGVSPILMDR